MLKLWRRSFQDTRRDDRGRDRLLTDLAIESLRRSGWLTFRAHGTSMLPSIRSGSIVSVQRVAPEHIGIGDIALAATPSGLRLHRVVAIRNDGAGRRFILRGDNHRHEDTPLDAAAILGRLA